MFPNKVTENGKFRTYMMGTPPYIKRHLYIFYITTSHFLPPSLGLGRKNRQLQDLERSGRTIRGKEDRQITQHFAVAFKPRPSITIAVVK